jgi:hypothetical protein
MGSSVLVVEQTPICVWCGVQVDWVDDPGCWLHHNAGRSMWCRGSVLHVATPTEWVDAIEPGFITAAQARAAMGW